MSSIRRSVSSLAVALVVVACAPAEDAPRLSSAPASAPGASAADARPSAPPETSASTTATPTSTRQLPDDTWTRLAPAPQALTEVAATAFADLVWVIGGLDARGQPIASVLHYEPVAEAWTIGPSLPQPLHHAAVAAADDAVYVLGGYTKPFGAGDLSPTNAVWWIDRADGTWESAPELPGPRGAGAAAWDGQRLVFAGGIAPDGVADEVWALEGEDGATSGV